MAITPCAAPKLDPAAVARLLGGRVPAGWLSCGYCQQCGPVLLPGARKDYGVLPTCPWCLVRQRGQSIPSIGFVRSRLREQWLRLPAYFKTAPPALISPVINDTAVGVEARDQPDVSWAESALNAPSVECAAGVEDVVTPPVEDVIGHITEVAHHPLDADWAETQLAQLHDPRQRVALRRRYGEIYQATFEAEPNVIRKEGRARYAANTWLREAVERLAQEQQQKGVPDGGY